MDNMIGTYQQIFGPHIMSHSPSDKFGHVRNSIVIGASPAHSCEFHNTMSKIMLEPKITVLKKTPVGGNIGVMPCVFASGYNGRLIKISIQ